MSRSIILFQTHTVVLRPFDWQIGVASQICHVTLYYYHRTLMSYMRLIPVKALMKHVQQSCSSTNVIKIKVFADERKLCAISVL